MLPSADVFLNMSEYQQFAPLEPGAIQFLCSGRKPSRGHQEPPVSRSPPFPYGNTYISIPGFRCPEYSREWEKFYYTNYSRITPIFSPGLRSSSDDVVDVRRASSSSARPTSIVER
eukprot:GHVU01058502.1.p1 GENE.GHVU01058502.1~~GHVU01058502.1.p1  ORF type:complete len:116 (-),score=4.36 GHVU01058502.1:350-697(-)